MDIRVDFKENGTLDVFVWFRGGKHLSTSGTIDELRELLPQAIFQEMIARAESMVNAATSVVGRLKVLDGGR